MDRVLVFYVLQLLVTAYALARGGAPERIAGLSLLIATLCTQLLQDRFAVRFAVVEWNVFGVDVCLSLLLLAVALYADRFWTFWLVALQTLGTAAHLVKLADHEELRFAYAVLTAAWSYPMLMLLVAGTARHSRRLRICGVDVDWSAPPAA